MSLGIYLVGYIILIAGLAIGANLLHVPMQWIGGGHSLFDPRGDRPWRDGDPTKGFTVLGVASRASPGSLLLTSRLIAIECMCRFLLARWQFESNSSGARFYHLQSFCRRQ
jgi:hypothetical protein